MMIIKLPMKGNKYYLIILVLTIIFTAFFFYSWRTILLEKFSQDIKNKASNLELNRKNISDNNSQILQQIKNEKYLKKVAKETNVRIFAIDNDTEIGGTGVLIEKQNNSYLVITNNHVINKNYLQYKVALHDGKVYDAKIIKQNNDNNNQDDLAILKFNSEEEYKIIKIADKLLIKNEIVFASGFPFQKNLKQSQKLYNTLGNMEIILNKPLMGGYQFGYTNLVHNGMSGGSILNQKGELIGVNGLGKYPIFGNPYVYQDGLIIEEKETDKMSTLSWGIPVKKIKNFITNSN
jgi:S1-C subfamily serine protease